LQFFLQQNAQLYHPLINVLLDLRRMRKTLEMEN